MKPHQERLAAFMAEHKGSVPGSVLEYARRLYKVDPQNPDPYRSQPPLVWFEHHIDAVIQEWTREYVDVPKPSHLRLVKIHPLPRQDKQNLGGV